MTIFLLAILFVILNILDVTTTRKVLKNGGYEANPIARLLMYLHLFLPVKIVTVIIVVFLMSSLDEGFGVMLGLTCCGIYVFIVSSNFRTIRLQNMERCTQELP